MEQNTDRMWWTIGIVVLGGALIAGAVVLLSGDNGILHTVGEKLTALFNMGKDGVIPGK